MEFAKVKRKHFLHCLFWPKGIFLTFIFYLNVYCIKYTFRIYILLHIKKHYFTYFCCLFLKSSKKPFNKKPSFDTITLLMSVNISSLYFLIHVQMNYKRREASTNWHWSLFRKISGFVSGIMVNKGKLGEGISGVLFSYK